jgi:D-alanyl-lipoteichoic acid acyltransferase DltB (MBOAT superfamily)
VARDYLYISLGGNRHGRWKTYRNLFLTMLLGGLWPGASWNFMIRGGYHGTLLAVERAVLKERRSCKEWAWLYPFAGCSPSLW